MNYSYLNIYVAAAEKEKPKCRVQVTEVESVRQAFPAML